MTDRLRHLFWTNADGSLASCICGHGGDLVEHARTVLPVVTATGAVRPPAHLDGGEDD